MRNTDGPCAKVTVTCTIVSVDGQHFVGTNYCRNAQSSCPRAPGEGYEKCGSICKQVGHAEIVALMLAGAMAQGATAYLEGHTYACQHCQEALFAAGVRYLAVSKPPAKTTPEFLKATDVMSAHVQGIIAEFGTNPKECLAMISDYLGMRDHFRIHGTLGGIEL